MVKNLTLKRQSKQTTLNEANPVSAAKMVEAEEAEIALEGEEMLTKRQEDFKKRYKFENSSKRVAKIDIKFSHKLNQVRTAPYSASLDKIGSFFYDELEQRLLMNPAKQFHALYHSIIDLSLSLPLILHNQSTIVAELLNALDLDYLRLDVLKLFEALMQDLRQEAYDELCARIFPKLCSFIKITDLETLEATYTTIAIALKFNLTRFTNDIPMLIGMYAKNLFMGSPNPNIVRFTAESLSYVLKKLEKEEQVKEVIETSLRIVNENQEKPQIVQFLAAMIVEVLKGHGKLLFFRAELWINAFISFGEKNESKMEEEEPKGKRESKRERDKRETTMEEEKTEKVEGGSGNAEQIEKHQEVSHLELLFAAYRLLGTSIKKLLRFKPAALTGGRSKNAEFEEKTSELEHNDWFFLLESFLVNESTPFPWTLDAFFSMLGDVFDLSTLIPRLEKLLCRFLRKYQSEKDILAPEQLEKLVKMLGCWSVSFKSSEGVFSQFYEAVLVKDALNDQKIALTFIEAVCQRKEQESEELPFPLSKLSLSALNTLTLVSFKLLEAGVLCGELLHCVSVAHSFLRPNAFLKIKNHKIKLSIIKSLIEKLESKEHLSALHLLRFVSILDLKERESQELLQTAFDAIGNLISELGEGKMDENKGTGDSKRESLGLESKELGCNEIILFLIYTSIETAARSQIKGKSIGALVQAAVLNWRSFLKYPTGFKVIQLILRSFGDQEVVRKLSKNKELCEFLVLKLTNPRKETRISALSLLQKLFGKEDFCQLKEQSNFLKGKTTFEYLSEVTTSKKPKTSQF